MKTSLQIRNCVHHKFKLFRFCLLFVFSLSTLFLNPINGENSNRSTLITVEDISPIAVCQDFSTFLDFSGTKQISPQNVNGGSFDPDGTIVDYSLDQAFFTCDDLGVNVVTLTVEDNEGNTASCTANVTVSYPTQSLACISQVNLSLDINGNGNLEPEDVLAGAIFDPCDLFTVTPSSFTCDDLGLQTVIVDDGQGNSCWLNVLVEDKIPPSFIFPNDVTLNCNADTSPSITGEPVIIDNCGQFGTSFEDQILQLPGDAVKILRTWTIIDWITGDVVTHIQLIKTEDTTGPTLVCFSNVNVSLGASGNVTILPEFLNAGSTDDCGSISFDVSPSEFDCSDIGTTVAVFLTGTDEAGNSNQCWSNVLIEDKLAPTPICNALVNVSLGPDGTATITPDVIDAGSYDNCGPVTLVLNQTTFDCSDINNDSLFVILTVTDQSGNSNECWAEIVVEYNIPLNIVWPADVTIDCSASTDPSATGEPVIIDNCGFTAYAYQDEFFDLGGASVKILRNWTVIDWLTGEIQEHIQIIKVLDTTGPSLACFDNVNVSLDATGNVTILPEFINAGATDDCSSVSYEVSPNQFDCSDIGTTVVVFLTATDESGNSNQCWSNVLIEDKLSPTAVCNAFVNVSLGPDGTATITPDVINAGSYDNCGPLTFGLSQTTFDCSNIGDSIVVILTVTDPSGNTNQCWAEINIEDNTPPEVVWPADVTIDCSASTDPSATGEPVIIDNCGFTAIAYQDEFFDLGGASVKILRNWTVIDWLTGDIQEYIQIIKVLDTTGPSLACFDNVNVSLDATGNVTILPEFINAGATDDCSSVSYEVSPNQFDCSDIGTTVVVFLTATDESGNSNQCWSNVLIEDKLSPTAVCNAFVNVSLGPDGTATITPDVIDGGSYDNCGPLTFGLSQTTFDCSNIGDSIVVILTVTDPSGNTNQCWAEINIEDKLPPTVTCPPDVTVDCADGNVDPEFTGFPTVVDNCDLIGYSYEDQIFLISGASSKILRKWIVVDWYSNSFDTCYQIIKVLDTTAPDLVCLNQVTAALDLSGSLTLYAQDLIQSVSDDCDSVSLTFFPNQFDCSNVGDNTVTVTATDGTGNLSQCTVIVTIQDNKPPTPFCNALINVSLGADGTATLLAEDVDAGSFDACGGPVTLSINPSTFDCSNILDNGTMVTLTVTDESGNSDFCIAQVIVEDKLPATVTCPFDLTIECSQAGNLDPILTGSPFVEDNCDFIGYSYEDSVFELDGANYKVIREWIIVDWYSNSYDSCTQVIHVLDVTPPDILCLNQLSANLNANGSLTLFPGDLDAGTTDACGEVELSISQSQFDCTNVGSNMVTLTATDENDNSSQCVVEVIIFGLDSDGDGFSICNGDCNDNDNTISPNAPELCGDNIDNNCNGTVDENCICASFAESTQYEWIESIDVNGTTNTSGNDNGYGDYTSITLPMTIGSNSIELNPGFSGSSYNEFWSVWIDLNQNGQYESSEEVLAQSSNGQIVSTIEIPSSALLGTTTMRISMKYGQSSDPCEMFNEGEVEDYTVDIGEPEYCISEGESTQYEWIKKVRLKTINNLSGNDNGYADFTNLSTSLNPGQSKNIKLKPGFSGDSYLEYWRVWVDWNEDGDFDDSGELEVEASSTGNITDQITVPNSASSGNKIMRVSMRYNGYADPCDVIDFGEVEDYTIFINGNNPLVGQSGLPDAITIDNDHSKAFTQVIETRDLDAVAMTVKLFPNPTTNYINLEINSSANMDTKLTMYNQVGQTVYQVTTDLNKHIIDVTDNKFLNGMYMIIIQQGDLVLSKRVIVTK